MPETRLKQNLISIARSHERGFFERLTARVFQSALFNLHKDTALSTAANTVERYSLTDPRELNTLTSKLLSQLDLAIRFEKSASSLKPEDSSVVWRLCDMITLLTKHLLKTGRTLESITKLWASLKPKTICDKQFSEVQRVLLKNADRERATSNPFNALKAFDSSGGPTVVM